MTSLKEQRRALARARAGEGAHHAGVAVAGAGPRQPRNPAAASTAAPHQRFGDRGSGDDGDDGDGDDDDTAAPRGLPVSVRYADLVAAGIVANWTTLLRLIDDEGFPPGIMIGPNTRAWRVDAVERWLAERPSARKSISPDARHPRVRKHTDELNR